MKLSVRLSTIVATAAMAAGALCAMPAAAQTYGPDVVPPYTTWQAGWNSGRFDRMHVILGTVAGFTPYRLTVALPNGGTQMVDLKNGTEIYPTGATPSEGERVALVGYYSKGTFIANRVILHG